MKIWKSVKILILLTLFLVALTACQVKEAKPPTNNKASTAKCGIQSCHGLAISCGPHVPEVCTELYQLGDFCRQYVDCKIINDECQLVQKEQFELCKSCVRKCEQPNSTEAFKCEDLCRKQLLSEEKTEELENLEDNKTSGCNLIDGACCQGENGICQTANLNCLNGFIPQIKDCNEKCEIIAECVPAETAKEDSQPLTDTTSPDYQVPEQTANTADWNSFTHKTYNYTIKFPQNWHWDGSTVGTLVLSSEPIKSNDEALSENNLRIINAKSAINETDVEIVNLDTNFKAVYLKNHPHQNIIKQIINSFTIK